jgi:hypothetical protein
LRWLEKLVAIDPGRGFLDKHHISLTQLIGGELKYLQQMLARAPRAVGRR